MGHGRGGLEALRLDCLLRAPGRPHGPRRRSRVRSRRAGLLGHGGPAGGSGNRGTGGGTLMQQCSAAAPPDSGPSLATKARACGRSRRLTGSKDWHVSEPERLGHRRRLAVTGKGTGSRLSPGPATGIGPPSDSDGRVSLRPWQPRRPTLIIRRMARLRVTAQTPARRHRPGHGHWLLPGRRHCGVPLKPCPQGPDVKYAGARARTERAVNGLMAATVLFSRTVLAEETQLGRHDNGGHPASPAHPIRAGPRSGGPVCSIPERNPTHE